MSSPIARAIFSARNSSGFSQEALAQLIGSNQALICEYEKGRKEPRPKTVRAIAKALNVDPLPLIGLLGLEEEEQKEPPPSASKGAAQTRKARKSPTGVRK